MDDFNYNSEEVSDNEYNLHYDEDNSDSESSNGGDSDNDTVSNDGSELNSDIEDDIVHKTNSKKSHNVMTKFEYDRLVGAISSMIDLEHFRVPPKIFEYTNSLNEFGEKLDSSLDIAKAWIKYNMREHIPLRIERQMPNGTFEKWNIEDLQLPNDL